MIPRWLPFPAPLQSTEAVRSPWLLESIVRQFDLETNERYQPTPLNAQGRRSTFCNIFLWDFTRAMSAEIPHWVDAVGSPATPGHGRELNANATLDWLMAHGQRFGWTPANEFRARTSANEGRPSIAIWKHPHAGVGHVAVVVSARVGETWIAQAGARCFSRGPIARGFGRLTPQFWIHP